MTYLVIISLLIVSSPIRAIASGEDTATGARATFAEAARLYAEGNWAGAEAKLEPLPPEDWSVEGLLLSGHASARQGKTARAMLAYRRVLELRPGQPEAAQNLSVLARRQGVVESIPPGPILGFLLSVPAEGYVLAATVATWLSFAGGAILVFRPRRSLLILATVAVSSGLPALATVGTAWVVKERAIKSAVDSPPRVWRPDGQLMEESPLFSEPARSAERVVESMPPGTPVRLVRQAAWSYVEVPSGNQGPPLRGWVRNPSWLPLRPRNLGSGEIP